MSDKIGRLGFLKGALGAIGAAGAAIVVPPMIVENEILQPQLELLKPGTNVLKVNPDPVDILDPNGFEIVLRFPGGAEFQGKFTTRSLSYSQQWPEPIALAAGEHMIMPGGPSSLDLELITAPGNEPTWSTWEDSNV